MDYVESRSDGCPSAVRVDRETVSVETRDSETRATSPISEVRTRKLLAIAYVHEKIQSTPSMQPANRQTFPHERSAVIYVL